MTRSVAHIRHLSATALAVSLLVWATTPAHAAGSNMPWEQPLQQILQSIEGPVAKIMAVIIIIVTGLTLAFGDTCVIRHISACRGNAMLNLAEYRKKPRMLADFLPWAALVAPGVVLNKDGSFQRTARFRGPDLESATPAELVGTTARLNNALRRLGSGWAIFVEASRHLAQRYPRSEFPDAVSALVEAERRAQFEEEGAHFESAYYL